MKVKKDIFYFEAGRYVIGDISNLLEENDFKKVKSSIAKLKSKCGFNKKYGLYFFKGIERKFIDYIEYNSYIIAENCLGCIPESLVKQGRLSNCKRFIAKSQFTAEYINDNIGVAVSFKEMNAPGPFIMMVQSNEI